MLSLEEQVQEQLVTRFRVRHGIDLSQHPEAFCAVQGAAVRAAGLLRSQPVVEVSLPCILKNGAEVLHLEEMLERRDFEIEGGCADA